MPVTALDERSALVTIDLQNMLRAFPLTSPLEDVVANARRLADAFRAHHLPVVNVRVSFSPDFGDAPRSRADAPMDLSHLTEGWDQHVEELAAQPTDILVTKHQFGAFTGTDLDVQLRRRGVSGIVFAGAATSVGVESTARAATEHNYNVTIASDAVADINLAAHRNSLEHIFPIFAEVDTTDAILAELNAR